MVGSLIQRAYMEAQRPTVLITGACGFIGSALVECLLTRSPYRVVIVDKMSYASRGLERVRDVVQNCESTTSTVETWTWDLQIPVPAAILSELGDVRCIYHLAAETHVDNSIRDPRACVINNIAATVNILELARKCPNLECFLHFSTDEVYGPCVGRMPFVEEEKLNASNPYSASKAAGEQICNAYCRTYKVPVKTTRSMNVLGPSQDTEKFLPKLVEAAVRAKHVDLHMHEDGTWGSRGYIAAADAADAAIYVAAHGVVGEVYNIPCTEEIDNITMLNIVRSSCRCNVAHRGSTYDKLRPGHDLRYAIDGAKLLTLGWKPKITDLLAYIRACVGSILQCYNVSYIVSETIAEDNSTVECDDGRCDQTQFVGTQPPPHGH